MRHERIVQAEALDQLPPGDAQAMGARRDLRRIHRVMRTRAVLRAALRAVLPPRAAACPPLHILELGAGDGSLLLGVARDLAGQLPPVALCLLDRQRAVEQGTLDAYAALGWDARCHMADALEWARHGAARDAATAERWDLIVASLFLHHFDDAALVVLLRAAAARTSRFLACEPRRAWLPLAASRLVFVLGASRITRADAVLSVRAGFRGREISTLWPAQDRTWRLHEGRAGVFGHGFRALAPG